MKRLICPNRCKTDTDTPFFYSPGTFDLVAPGHELGVLAYSDGSPSNRFQDGIAGVQKEIIAEIEASDDMPHCIVCMAEAVRAK